MPDGLIAAERTEIGQVDQRFDLREAVSFLWRQWKFIATVTALTVLAALVVVLRQTPFYTATAQVSGPSQAWSRGATLKKSTSTQMKPAITAAPEGLGRPWK